jgi:hypothetical protein
MKGATGEKWKSSFPPPKFLKVFDTEKGKNAVLFFEYWEKRSQEPELVERIRVKVYRTWPQIDFKIVEPERKDMSWDVLDGAIPFPSVEYRTWFLEKYYSGSWNCQLYEHTGGNENPLVMQCFFDSIELDKFEPRVNLRTVLWGKTANKSYEQFLRSRNIPIPGDAEYQEQQDMTTGGAIIAEAMKQNAELAKENREILKEQIAAGPKQDRPDSLALEGLRAYTTMITDGARAAIEIGKSKDMANAKQYDPLEMIEKVIPLLNGGAGGGSAMVQLVLTSAENQARLFSEMHNQTLAYMRGRDQAPALAASTQKAGLDLLVEEAPKLEAIGKLFGWSRRGGAAEEAPPPQSNGWFGKVMEQLVANPANLQAIAGIVAIAGQTIMTLMGKTPPPPVEQPKTDVAKPAEPAKEEPRQPTQEERNQMFLEWIEPEFLRHFNDKNLGGSAFAQTFISMVQTPQGAQFAPGGPPTPLGIQQLGLLRATGMQSFDRLLRSYSPIWSQVQSYAIQPMNSKEKPKYYQFLEEFFGYNPARATA